MDWRNRYGLRDSEIGLLRLRRKVCQYGIKARRSLIYDTQTGDLLERYVDGIETINSLTPMNSKKYLRETYQDQIILGFPIPL